MFYPDFSSEFYYADPGDENRYIALSEYFAYLKQERINELQLLAKALGAKHFKVTYKEESDAIKIDAVLKGLKCSAMQNIVNEVKKESQRYLEYEIDFE